MSVRGTGFAMLSSANVQQAHDMALIAHAATMRARVPFVHFFDGFRTSHEESRITRISDETIREMIPLELVMENRARGFRNDNPTIRGTAQNPDVFFQGREAVNQAYDKIPEIVTEMMKKLAKLTGRKYGLVDYVGVPDAENILVAMGSGTETITETLNHLPAKTGLIVIHLFNPFPTEAFLAALPKTAKQIAVLDRTKEPGAIGEPLYMDITAALKQMEGD
jgi:pyruvate-ferredoxin/flavodoxin oxidoreductase